MFIFQCDNEHTNEGEIYLIRYIQKFNFKKSTKRYV